MLFEKRGDRVGAEAAALAVAAGHPGVVELVGAADGLLRTTLLRDARPLAGGGPLTADELAGVVASVAATLADLHDLGVVHGGVDGRHVLLASDGRPVLCSLGRGGAPADDVLALGTLAGALLAGCASPPRPSRRMPGRAGRGSPSPGRAPGVGQVPCSGPGRAPKPWRLGRLGPGRARKPWRLGRRPPRLGAMLAPDAAAALASVLAEATVAAPAARPTARALAVAVHQRVPTACLPRPAGDPQLPLSHRRPPSRSWWRTIPYRPPAGPQVLDRMEGRRRALRREPLDPVAGRTRAEPERGHEPAAPGADAVPAASIGSWTRVPDQPGGVRPSGRRRPAAQVAAVVAVGVMVAAAVTVSPGVQRGRRPPAEPTTSPAAGDAARRPPPSVASPTTAPPPVAVRVWPPEPLDFHDGVLTIDGARYAVGRPGDTVVAGDWACSGLSTLALLRPDTGEVFAFDDWPAEGAAATARPLGTVAGATAARIVDADGDGCDDLELLRPGNDPVRLAPAA